MKIINKLKAVVPLENGVWVAIGVALLLLLGGLAFYKKHKGKLAPKVKKDAPVEQKKEAGIPAKGLVKAWKDFLSEIPGEFRRIIMIYQHFVVFGENGAGKSRLIDSHTDWQGHARQFYPSYTGNPLLQVYLGSKVLVQEIPSAILNDTTKSARVALLKLWGPLFRRKDPTAVVVLNSASFQTDEPIFLKKEAQMLRGKINLLARVRKKPISVRMVLTNMERYEGFAEFAKFLNKHGIPLNLSFESKEDLANLENCLEAHEAHLSRAVVTLPAGDYLKMMTFLETVPELFREVATFIDVLQSPDPLTPEPEIVSLSLAFLEEGHAPVSNPFDTTLTSSEIRRFNPLYRHRIAAGVLGVAGLAYMIGGFMYEYRLIGDRYLKIAEIEKAPLSQYNQNMHKLFVDPNATIQERTLLDFLPDFFPHANRAIFARGIENIRNHYLLPELEKYSVSSRTWDMETLEKAGAGGARNKALYLTGLLYATKSNDLGELIRENLDAWAQTTGLSNLLIEDYVKHNRSTEDLTIDLADYIYSNDQGVIDDPFAITVFFEKVKKFYYQPVITASEFDSLRREAEGFLARIREVERHDLSVKVTALLQKEAMLSVHTQQANSAEFKAQIQQAQVKDFLRFIRESRITRPEITEGMNLANLYENLKVMEAYKGFDGDEEAQYRFMLSGREFKFGTARWNALLNRSRMSLFVNDFIAANLLHDGLLFFQKKEDFPDLVMNASNNGMFLFKGQTRVDGRFTKVAFEKRVRPVIQELPAFMETLPVPDKDKMTFMEFLLDEMDAYGMRYAEAYKDYYLDFDIDAKAEASLRYVLKQLTLPSSPILEVLENVKANTLLGLDDTIYMRSFARNMSHFRFLERLLVDEKGVYPEMEKYKALLEQMEMEMDNPAAVAGADVFRKRLTAMGQIAFSVFRNDENSYLNLITQWMESVGIPYDWRAAFVAPVYSAYNIGLPEIEAEITRVWTELDTRDIQPLYKVFPFDRTATKDVSPATLARVSHPSGPFWQTFKEYLAPVLVEKNGYWEAYPTPLDGPVLPEKLIATVNAVKRLTDTLWTTRGDEKPIEFMVKPYPFDAGKAGGPVVTLAYLHAGDDSVFAFNQQPSWKRIRIHWSRESTATVGVEIQKPSGATRMRNAATIGKSSWSFFHLLRESVDAESIEALASLGQKTDGLGYENLAMEELNGEPTLFTWLVPLTDAELGNAGTLRQNGREKGLKIRFSINNRDPWAPFRLPL